MKKIFAILIAALMLCSLAACEKDDVSDNYFVPAGSVSGGDVSGGDAIAPEGSDTLPEDLICAWEVVDIYQESPISEIDPQAALEKERREGMLFGYNTFARAGETVDGAQFFIRFDATYKEMYQYFGIQTESLQNRFGADAEIISIAVSDAEGSPCTTVYIINRELLIAFGSGMNVFTYTMVDSVG